MSCHLSLQLHSDKSLVIKQVKLYPFPIWEMPCLVFQGTGTLIDWLYKDYPKTWHTSVLVLTFLILHSSRMALIGVIFMN